MNLAAVVAQDVTAVAFVALGVAITYQWYRERSRAQAMLAGALDSIGLVAVLGRLGAVVPPMLAPAIGIVTIVAFVAAAYFVLLFRNEFIPLSKNALLAARVLVAVSILAGIALTVFPHAPKALTSIFLIEVIAAWAVLIGEPIVRFWLASIHLPAVQKARMRFLSLGFALWILVVLAASIAGAAIQSSTATFITQLVSLATVPLIYVSFSPPPLVRRLWRMGEESAVRAAMQDLLIFSPNRQVMAERAVSWAVRLMGATAGFVVDEDGKIIAVTGIDKARAATLSSSAQPETVGAAGAVITAPLHLTDGPGKLVVVAGPFTPVFGSDEISQLNAYANSVSAGLERARVTERMAAIERNKTQFLNLASHELRGPITVIRGYVSMLESGMLGQLNERGRKAAGVMTSKVAEMNDLIEEMMEAARLEEGALSLRPVDTDLREVTKAAAEAVAPMVDRSHRLVLDLPERRIRVHVDPDRTKTIILNLLSNAIKYSPRGGTITCHVRARAGIARVAVTDEGLGIAREHLPTLFTRFGRVVTPETEHLKGTGLGLFLSRQLARLQGGDITVVSDPGNGSTFTLQLPVASAQESDARGPNGAAAPQSRVNRTTSQPS